ncbi:MAG: C-GCAxxG-C-C family protein [Bacteroidetes bacterium]|nr:C-GCAxxG-C-C family protein [Bacteroidota bacterium]
MKETITRGSFLKRSAVFTLGATAIATGAGLLIPKSAKANTNRSWPWPYVTLDPELARIRAHDDFWGGNACCYGVFNGVISLLKDAIGEPYDTFPTELMIYGHGGGAGWGATCGTINGGAGVISLVCAKADSDILVNELFGWYTQTLFPSTISNDYAMNHLFGIDKFDGDLVQTESGSPLCHSSVTKWCNVANIAVDALERKERCARSAGDVAAKVVELLNEHFAGTFEPGYVPPESIATCMACHGSTGTQHNVAAKQECVSCHGENPHGTGIFIGNEKNFELTQNYPNPFNQETTFEFSLTHPEKVTLVIYSLNGEQIKTLASNRSFSTGKQTLKWDGRNEFGANASPGMYIYRFKAGDSMKSLSMMKMK